MPNEMFFQDGNFQYVQAAPVDQNQMVFNQFQGENQMMVPQVNYLMDQPFGNNMEYYGAAQPNCQYAAMDYGQIGQMVPQQNNENMFDYNFEAAPAPAPRKRRSPKTGVQKVAMHANTSCINCGCRETKLWRRNEKGEPECNPCNLYERFKGTKRPAHLWNKPTIKRRRRPVAQVNEAPQVKEDF
uniref:GATA-type domain-containing protein n=1 Tax=Caenorhabditis tropicalis TaxID=1561998 RepID=A0A1I7T2Q3_9PELO